MGSGASKAKTDQERHPENYFVSGHGHVKDRIILHDSEKVPKEGQVFSLNGYAYLIKPGVEVDIPRPVRQMIDTLIERQTIQGDDGKDYNRDVKRFNYTLVKEGVNVPAPAVEGG